MHRRHAAYNDSMRTVFVSGASGFVGSAVVAELLRRGCHVHATVHSRDLRLNDARVTCFRGNLDDTTLLDRALERCSAAIHRVGIIRENRAKNVTFPRRSNSKYPSSIPSMVERKRSSLARNASTDLRRSRASAKVITDPVMTPSSRIAEVV